MNILYIIGPRGSGKTLTSRLIAQNYGCPSFDVDDIVVETQGKSVAEIVAEGGWPAFRAAEKNALIEGTRRIREVGGGRGVVATGGGIILDPENREFMRSQGRVAYLEAPVEELVRRLQPSQERNARPPLSSLSFEDEIRMVIKEREPIYKSTAHEFVDASLAPEKVVEILFSFISGEDFSSGR